MDILCIQMHDTQCIKSIECQFPRLNDMYANPTRNNTPWSKLETIQEMGFVVVTGIGTQQQSNHVKHHMDVYQSL